MLTFSYHVSVTENKEQIAKAWNVEELKKKAIYLLRAYEFNSSQHEGPHACTSIVCIHLA